MTTRPTILAALFPFLTVAVLLWSASCSRAQIPPTPEWSWRSLLVWQVPMPAPQLQLEYRLKPHWCQTPDNVAFYYSDPPFAIWSLVPTNVFTADRPCRLFIGWHWCSTNDAGQQCEIRLTRL